MLESTWRKFTPQGVYEYFFIDESLARLHRSDQQFGQIFKAFATLAIFIACLGLFGLISFAAEQRTKEIGVRKVLGATVMNIILLISKDFVKLLFIANLIACPIAYYVMTHWLQNFAYKTSIGIEIFMFSAIIVCVIALITVSFQSIKAAIANPIKSIRYE